MVETISFDLAVIGTGFALGIVHVLTGPDHLSALCTLSSESSGGVEAFSLGIRWGFGHSFGLLLVGSILLLRDFSTENTYTEVPDVLSNILESLVGVFMILLGMRGFWQAYKKRQSLPACYVSINDQYEAGEEDPMLPGGKKGNSHYGSYQLDPMSHFHAFGHAVEEDDTVEVRKGQDSLFSCCERLGCSRNMSIKSLAILAGTIHGFAGPGGVLGVIPAVQLHNLKLAAMYIGCFTLSSTLTMGCFAWLYGTICAKLGQKMEIEFQLQLFSAFLSFLVGVTWLVLLHLGILDDIFP